MRRLKSIIQFVLIIAALLLAIWSQSWLVIIIVFLVSALLWCPLSFPISRLRSLLSPLQYRIGEWVIAIVIAFIVFWFGQYFLFNFYTIRSTSMEPTLNVDELIVINKLAYGPAIKVNSCKSYRRLNGYSQLRHGDVIAFYFPEADTAFVEHSKEDYYFIKRQYETTKSYNPLLDSKLKYNKVTDRKPFIKRVVALPGDTLKIEKGNIFINLKYLPSNEISINRYQVKTKLTNFVRDEILKNAIRSYRENGHQLVELQEKIVVDKGWSQYLTKVVDPLNRPSPYVFPFKRSYFWNASYLGPIIIPTKGKTVRLTLTNIPLYKRIIESYEGNELDIKDQTIYINKRNTKEYTFKMNYYWVAGDNKEHSFDSRFWGFVPENHIIGKVSKFAN